MVLGVGVDILAVGRMREILDGPGMDAFLKKVYTPSEVQRAKDHHDSVACFAKTFAAKEAVFKCFAIDWDTGVQFNEIEIREGSHGEPIAEFCGQFAKVATERKVVRAFLSLSYDGDYAIAMATLEGNV